MAEYLRSALSGKVGGVADPEIPPSTLEREALTTPSQRRFQAIYLTLRERITLLQYKPGTPIDIDALAEEFRVSRTPMRSVLQQLAYHGLVISRHGVRTSVSTLDFDKLREAQLFRSQLAELIGELTPRTPEDAAIEAMHAAEARCSSLMDNPDPRSFASIDIQVHEAVCSLIGNLPLLQTYDDLYFRTARMWFYFLPRLDWRNEVQIFQRDIEARRQAMEIGDIKAVGFITRNAVSSVLIRLDSLFRQIEAAEEPDAPPL